MYKIKHTHIILSKYILRYNTMRNITKIILGIGILFLLLGMVYAEDRIQDVTTPYGTKCKLNIGGGLNPDETTVNDDGQKLAFNDGYKDGLFISTTQDVSDLLDSIKSSGTKCSDDNIVWYHMKDQELSNTWSPLGGDHLKLDTTTEYDVGFMENPNSDEVIILIAGPDTIVDCFKSIEWG